MRSATQHFSSEEKRSFQKGSRKTLPAEIGRTSPSAVPTLDSLPSVTYSEVPSTKKSFWTDTGSEELTDSSTKPPIGNTLSLMKELFEGKKAALIEQDAVKKEVYTHMDFEQLLNLHRQHQKYGANILDVIIRWEEFVECDLSADGRLSFEEFQLALRRRLNIQDGGPIPGHLLDKHWMSFEGEVDFAQYLEWALQHAFAEEVLVPDRRERRIRQLARDHNLSLCDIEKVQRVYDQFDHDGSGNLDRDEFAQVMCRLLKTSDVNTLSDRTLERYWHEVDSDFSGTIEFEEFLNWYMRYFSQYV